MEGLQHDPCQMGQVKTKAHEEAEAMEEQTRPSEAWSKTSASALSSELVVEDTTITVPLSEPLLGLILRMPASLQHVFTDGSPVILPLEVELAGRVEPQTIATPIITTTPGCFSLPLIFDQPHMQYIRHQSSCPISEHQNLLYHQNQNNGLSQNLSSLPVGQSHSSEGKSNIRQMSENTMMHSFDVLAALQELFPFFKKSSSSACPSSFPINAFNTGFMPPNTSPSLAHLYSGSPLLSTLPPATLLVPFPLVVPLPVPLPIPIPIPIPPFSGTESHFKPSQTMKTSKSTQTMTEDVPVCTHNTMSGYDFLQLPTQRPPPPPVSQEEVLDLSVKVVPTQTKQEFQVSYYQDKVLDLSVANKSRRIKSSKEDKRKHHESNSTNQESTIQILPKKRSQTRATNQLNAYSDVELSMHYKWTTEEHYENYDLKYLGKNGGVITPKQIPRVSQSTKDTSVMSCEKLIRPLQGQVLENRVIKQKRTNIQNINIPPIKKQHLMRFLPRK